MDKIAFIVGDSVFYWPSVLLTLGAACAICLFLGFYLYRGGSWQGAVGAVPMALLLSLVLGRLIHWYGRADCYGSLGAALTSPSGNYALLGAFLGCGLTAAILRAAGLCYDLGEMLDAMSAAGAGGIAVGRLAYFYSASDRGYLTRKLACPVVNPVSGAVEYRLATFLIQALVTAAIFGILIPFFFSRKRKNGDAALLFLLLYGAEQTVLDSTRYDSLFLRSNGFISLVQLLSAASAAAVCVVLAVRLVRRRGFRGWYPLLWTVMAALLGGAGYMEYYVQRHGNLTALCYSAMSGCMVCLCALAVAQYGLANEKT